VLAIGQNHASDCDFVHRPDGFVDEGEGVVPNLAVRAQVVRADQMPPIDLVAVDELVDLDRSRRFLRNVLELLSTTCCASPAAAANTLRKFRPPTRCASMAGTRSARASCNDSSATPAGNAPGGTKKMVAGRASTRLSRRPLADQISLRLDVRMAQKHHPTPLSAATARL
jgi:hypothetical protein